ncbi:MAG: hypothetical protein IKQ45_06810 [Clostridia bacterium]|nr:hypothetical protein [Clostridia bacterium]
MKRNGKILTALMAALCILLLCCAYGTAETASKSYYSLESDTQQYLYKGREYHLWTRKTDDEEILNEITGYDIVAGSENIYSVEGFYLDFTWPYKDWKKALGKDQKIKLKLIYHTIYGDYEDEITLVYSKDMPELCEKHTWTVSEIFDKTYTICPDHPEMHYLTEARINRVCTVCQYTQNNKLKKYKPDNSPETAPHTLGADGICTAPGCGYRTNRISNATLEAVTDASSRHLIRLYYAFDFSYDPDAYASFRITNSLDESEISAEFTPGKEPVFSYGAKQKKSADEDAGIFSAENGHISIMIPYRCGQSAVFDIQAEIIADTGERVPLEAHYNGDKERIAWQSLLSALEKNDNPLDHPEITEMFVNRLKKEWLYDQAQADEITALLNRADPAFRDLFLYTFFDYSKERELDISTVGTYYSLRFNDVSLSTADPYSTVFHQFGHAIDANILYTSTPEGIYYSGQSPVRESLEYAIREDVKDYLRKQLSDRRYIVPLKQLGLESVDAAIELLLSEPSSDGQIVFMPKMVLVQETLSDDLKASCQAMSDQADSVMLYDLMDIITGHRITARDSEEFGDNSDSAFADTTSELAYGLNQEAWAAYFSSKINGTSENNEEFFPRTVAYMDQMAEEMLAVYRERIR